jgi:TPP-dependent trihydroxycyclohexane-1,2-dione (THcHDO) dehydratase
MCLGRLGVAGGEALDRLVDTATCVLGVVEAFTDVATRVLGVVGGGSHHVVTVKRQRGV